MGGLARMSTERLRKARCAPDDPFLRQESGSLEHHGEVDLPPLADLVMKEEVAWVQSARGVRLFQTGDEHGAEAHNATMPRGYQAPHFVRTGVKDCLDIARLVVDGQVAQEIAPRASAHEAVVVEFWNANPRYRVVTEGSTHEVRK